MEYFIGKFEGEDVRVVGKIVADKDSISLETDDVILKEWLEDAISGDIYSTEFVSGINERGHRAFGEVERAIHPDDPYFTGAFQDYLPEDYIMMDLLEEEKEESSHRKTA